MLRFRLLELSKVVSTLCLSTFVEYRSVEVYYRVYINRELYGICSSNVVFHRGRSHEIGPFTTNVRR